MNWHWHYMDNLKYVKLVDYDMKFPKKCPNCKQSFYDQEKHTLIHINYNL